MEIINPKTGDTNFHKIVSKGLEETKKFCEGLNFERKILEVSNDTKQRPIHIAVAAKDPELVKYLLQKGAEVDSYKKGDWTSLMVASALNGIEASEISQILIDAGANVELKNKDGWTAMHIACRTGHVTTVQILARHCPRLVTTPSRNGRLPLHIASLNSHIAVVQFLVEFGGKDTILRPDLCGSTPVLDATSGGSLDVLKYLSSLTDLKVHKDGRGFNCLLKAAQIGNVDVIKFLILEKGFDVNEETNDGFTAVMLAAMENHREAVIELIQLGAAPNSLKRNVFTLARGLASEELRLLFGKYKDG